jgi:hypothetical protein
MCQGYLAANLITNLVFWYSAALYEYNRSVLTLNTKHTMHVNRVPFNHICNICCHAVSSDTCRFSDTSVTLPFEFYLFFVNLMTYSVASAKRDNLRDIDQ